MEFRAVLLLLAFSVITVYVTAQSPITPAAFRFDCRRSKVDCKGDNGTCDLTTGACDCARQIGFEGYDCGLEESLVTDCGDPNPCENNGQCLPDSKCFCDSNTYGANCENPRVKMWCTESQMFINIYPHGDDAFKGNVYVRISDGENRRACPLKIVTDEPLLDLSSYPYVKTAQDETPTLKGYWIALDHAGSDSCPAAKSPDVTRDDYLQQAMIEYSTNLVSTVDQIVTFNCSIINIAGEDPLTSENAVSVSVIDDDYENVNVTEKLLPVLFSIQDPATNSVITGYVNLGDPLDLVFTLAVSADDPTATIKEFVVKDCSASNGQTDGPESVKFLENDCPLAESAMIFRGPVEQTDKRTKTIIPLNTFRFVGDSDNVVFTCSVKLCTDDTFATEGIDACLKSTCSEQPAGEDNSESGGEGEGGGEVTTPAPVPTTPAPGAKRRKRSADDAEEEVSKSIRVISPPGLAGSDTQDGSKEKEEEDCTQNSEVVVIIIIFVVVLGVMLIIIVLLTVNLLRSKNKVEDASDASTTDTQSRYTLPRLSLATTM